MQKMFMPTETIQQQRERCYVKKCRCLTTASGDKAVMKICMIGRSSYTELNISCIQFSIRYGKNPRTCPITDNTSLLMT